MTKEKSITDKLADLTAVAFAIVYKNTRGGYFHELRDVYLCDHSDTVWSLVDGLYQKWLQDRVAGHCSLQETIEFDLAEEEKKIDRWLVELTELKSKLEPLYEVK